VPARPKGQPRSGCPVNIALEILGDRWSLLVIRDLMVRGLRTFKEFQESGEGIASNILADRLRKLEAAGIVTVEAGGSDRRRLHYRLTRKGIDLAPVVLELFLWGARYERTGAPRGLVEHMAQNRQSMLQEVRRRWEQEDLTPLIPRFTPADPGRQPGQGPGSGEGLERPETTFTNPQGVSMSKVRVLVGTRKGAFILTSDGKRKQWEVSGPHFGGWEIYHMKGSPADPKPSVCLAIHGWFGQVVQRSDDGGQTWNTVGNKFNTKAKPAPTSGMTVPAPLGVQARLALRTLARRPGHRLRRSRGCRLVPFDRRRPELAGADRSARHGSGSPVAPGAGGMCLHTILLDPKNPAACSSPSPPQARSAATTPAKPGGPSTRGCGPSSSPTRMLRSATAFIASPCTPRAPMSCSCRSIGT
jgi:DNA-binding HxlR family transcriptional regulator